MGRRRTAAAVLFASAVVVMTLGSCGRLGGEDDEARAEPCAGPGEHASDCPVPEFDDRPFDVWVPSGYDGSAPTPLVLFLHGGGGNAAQTQATTCPDGELTDPACLHGIGEERGFITVYPNGTGTRLAPNVRTWNGGGGGPYYACASGPACDAHVDDIAYLTAVLDEVAREYNVDETRVYVMGFSNGAAMSNRVGCEMADRVAAIASVAGTNQFATNAECAPGHAMPVVHVHGTDDPCWAYETSAQACADQDPRPKLGVEESMAGWVERNGCDATPTLSTLPDTADDGTTTGVAVWSGCDDGAEVRLLTVNGGGHVFPGGERTGRPGADIGVATEDWGVETLWEFVSRFSLAAA